MPISHQHFKQRSILMNAVFEETPLREKIEQIPLWKRISKGEQPELPERPFKEYGSEGTPHDWKLPPDLTALGSGYDVFGDYAYSGSSMGKIFDFRYFATTRTAGYDVPTSVTAHTVKATDGKMFEGDDALELQRSLSTSVDVGGGFLGLFSGAVTANFNSTELRKVRRYYTIVQQLLLRNRYIFDWRQPAARKCLSFEFRYALENYAPEDIFRTFGTHFPTDIYTGARLDYSSSTNIEIFKSSNALAISAKASLNMLIGISAEANHSSESFVNQFRKASQSALTTFGGAYERAAAILLEGDASARAQRYAHWLDSIPDNEVFVAFGSKDCLRGVWELCDNPTRQKEIEAAAKEFMRRRDIECRITSDRIVDVAVISGSNWSIPAPSGFQKVPYDLNKGAKGECIYVCFRRESSESIEYNQERTVVDLATVGKGGKLTGFEIIPVDLNRGAEGDYIYLCKKFGEPGDPEAGIRDIVVIGGNHSNLTPPYGYKRLTKDLNAGAGGEFIYLCYI